MPKPACVPCQRFFRPVHNGFPVTEGMPITHPALPGTQMPEAWKPYKIWRCDKWRCEGCGTEILVGYGQDPVRIQHEADFAKIAKLTGADQLQINDC